MLKNQANAVKEKGKGRGRSCVQRKSPKMSEEEVKAVEERAVSSCDLQRKENALL